MHMHSSSEKPHTTVRVLCWDNFVFVVIVDLLDFEGMQFVKLYKFEQMLVGFTTRNCTCMWLCTLPFLELFALASISQF